VLLQLLETISNDDAQMLFRASFNAGQSRMPVLPEAEGQIEHK
jgi:hypothetical protein